MSLVNKYPCIFASAVSDGAPGLFLPAAGGGLQQETGPSQQGGENWGTNTQVFHCQSASAWLVACCVLVTDLLPVDTWLTADPVLCCQSCINAIPSLKARSTFGRCSSTAFTCCCHELSSVQDGICGLGKAHMCSTQSLRSFPNVAFETIPMFARLMMALFCPFNEESSSASSFHASLLQAIVPAGRVSSFTTLQIFREAVLFQAWRQTNPKTPLTVICCLSCFSHYFSAKLESKTNLKTLLSSAVSHVSVFLQCQAWKQD